MKITEEPDNYRGTRTIYQCEICKKKYNAYDAAFLCEQRPVTSIYPTPKRGDIVIVNVDGLAVIQFVCNYFTNHKQTIHADLIHKNYSGYYSVYAADFNDFDYYTLDDCKTPSLYDFCQRISKLSVEGQLYTNVRDKNILKNNAKKTK